MNLSSLLLIPFVLLTSKISCGNECQNLITHSVKICFSWFVLNQLPHNLFCCPYFLSYEKQQRMLSYSSLPCHSLFYTLLSYHTTWSQNPMILLFNFSFYRNCFIPLRIPLYINYILLVTKSPELYAIFETLDCHRGISDTAVLSVLLSVLNSLWCSIWPSDLRWILSWFFLSSDADLSPNWLKAKFKLIKMHV